MDRSHTEAQSQQYLDQRWIERYRILTDYDSRWWWTPTGPFNKEEQQEWNNLIHHERTPLITKRLDHLLVQARNREIHVAVASQREPYFHYPVLTRVIEDIHQRIVDLHLLDVQICQQEPHPIVRHLYHETIIEEIDFLHLMETAHTRDSDRFWEITRLLYSVPTVAEMQYAFAQLKNELLEGLRYTETVDLSLSLIEFVREQLKLPTLMSDQEIASKRAKTVPLPQAEVKQKVSAQAVKRFFEQILLEGGYTGWRVEIDPKANGASVSAALRRLTIQVEDLTLEKVRHLLSHEIAGHIARSHAGEQSPLGLLATGTAGYSATEEGLALYNERYTASLHGETFNNTGSWLGILSVGLACGVRTPPLSFRSLLAFMESLFLQRRLVGRLDEDGPTAQKYAHKRAVERCLRTFKGVPDLTQTGICYTKDVIYLRGLRKIEEVAAQDKAILDRLAIGKFALEQLEELEELNPVLPAQPLRERAFDPNLDAYILSFES